MIDNLAATEKLKVPFDKEKFLMNLLKEDEISGAHAERMIGVSLDDVVRLHYYRMQLPEIDYEKKLWQGFAVEQMQAFYRELGCSLPEILEILDAEDLSDLNDRYVTNSVEELYDSVERYMSLPAETRSSISCAAWDLIYIAEAVHDNIDVLN